MKFFLLCDLIKHGFLYDAFLKVNTFSVLGHLIFILCFAHICNNLLSHLVLNLQQPPPEICLFLYKFMSGENEVTLGKILQYEELSAEKPGEVQSSHGWLRFVHLKLGII